jgi:hypothetical protein
MTQLKRNKVFLLYIVALCLTFVVFFGFVAAEAYVRWSLNQNFSFLGGGLLPIGVLLLGQFGGLAYLLKSDD